MPGVSLSFEVFRLKSPTDSCSALFGTQEPNSALAAYLPPRTQTEFAGNRLKRALCHSHKASFQNAIQPKFKRRSLIKKFCKLLNLTKFNFCILKSVFANSFVMSHQHNPIWFAQISSSAISLSFECNGMFFSTERALEDRLLDSKLWNLTQYWISAQLEVLVQGKRIVSHLQVRF